MRGALVVALVSCLAGAAWGQSPMATLYGPEWWEGPWQAPVAVEGVNTTAHEVLLGVNEGGLTIGRMHVHFDAQWWEQRAEWTPFMTSRLGHPAAFDALEPMRGWGLQAPPWPGLGEVTHLSYDESGTWAVLSAYRDEQREDTDLFLVTRTRDGWSQARPLEGLNSAHNEVFPNWVGGRLVFGSDRPGGAGGFDLYVADRWSSFQTSDRLDAPLNGAGDDVAAMGTTGGWYVCTARPGGQGGLDVWWVGREEQAIPEPTAKGLMAQLKKESGEPWAGAVLELRGMEGAVWLREAVDAEGSVDLGEVPLRDPFSATVMVEEGSGYLEIYRVGGEKLLRLPVEAGVPFALNLLALDMLGDAGWTWEEDASVFPDPFAAVQILFATNSATLDTAAQSELLRWWERWDGASSTTQLRITGHADARGTRDRNESLSAARAEAVAAWFRAQGVAATALVVTQRGSRELLPEAEWQLVARYQPAYQERVPCERRVEVRWEGW